MNYEIKSAKEAKVLEIFFNKNTNKLSYKKLKGIVVSIDSVEDLATIQAEIIALQNSIAPSTTKVYQANLTQIGIAANMELKKHGALALFCAFIL